MKHSAVIGVALAAGLGACASAPDEQRAGAQEPAGPASAEGRFAGLSRLSMPSMPNMPSMPGLPSMRVEDFTIPGTRRPAPQVDPALEPVIYWRTLSDDILMLQVDSRGCTAKQHFRADVRQYHRDVYTLRLVRTARDFCEDDQPWGAQIAFGYEELGVPYGGRVIVLNPLDDRPWDWNPDRHAAADPDAGAETAREPSAD